MFSVYCPGHSTRVLLDTSRIWQLEGGQGGYQLRWLCWCGHDGVLTVGRRPEQPPQAAAPGVEPTRAEEDEPALSASRYHRPPTPPHWRW
jgi:hypothetical protein